MQDSISDIITVRFKTMDSIEKCVSVPVNESVLFLKQEIAKVSF